MELLHGTLLGTCHRELLPPRSTLPSCRAAFTRGVLLPGCATARGHAQPCQPMFSPLKLTSLTALRDGAWCRGSCGCGPAAAPREAESQGQRQGQGHQARRQSGWRPAPGGRHGGAGPGARPGGPAAAGRPSQVSCRLLLAQLPCCHGCSLHQSSIRCGHWIYN
jgi:hypothetical protein